MIDLNDAAAAVDIIVRFVRNMERHGDLGFIAEEEETAKGAPLG